MIASTQNSHVCPSPETVRKYLDGWSDEAASQQMEEHLSLCETCAGLIESDRNLSDHWLRAIRSETLPISNEATRGADERPSEEIDPIAQQAIERSKRLLQNDGSDVPAMPDKPFTHSVTALGEIGPYELVRPIGQGGMGYVMLARHKHLDKEVAVKILPSTPWRVPTEEARFQREVRAVGKLEHPSIVTALDAGVYQGTHFLAMEYVDGLDLSRLTKVLGQLSIPDACELIRQTALGLSYAHAQGIVHRDVKPSNLMLDRTGKVKILDFGLAQLQPWDDGCADLTSVGQLMGTLDYMAPEQAEHGGAVSYRADLYSLGATLFRLLVGRAPLAITPTQTPIEKLRLLSHHPIPRLKTMLPDAPEGLCSIVDNLLARDPGQRPPSAAHVADLLEPWAKGSELVTLLKKGQEIVKQTSESIVLNPSKLTSQWLAFSGDAGTSSIPEDQSSRGRGHWNWIIWTAAGMLAPLVAFGGFLLYFETQKGQVVVESEVAEVRVRVVSDGKEVDDIQLSQGVNSIRLRAGKYELLIDSPTDSITMSNQAFVLKNGETVVARIRRVESSMAPDAGAQASPGTRPDVPVYSGKSLDEWLAILDRERAYPQVKESLEAILGLATKSDRDIIRKPLDALVQRFLYNGEIISQALAIEKKIATDREFENFVREVLRIAQDQALQHLLHAQELRGNLKDDRMFAESIMSLDLRERGPEIAESISRSLVVLLQRPSDFKPEELRRYCERAFSSESARAFLVDPSQKLPDEVSLIMDSLVLRALNSEDSTPKLKADSLRYLLNPESLARVRTEVMFVLEKILKSMSNDDGLRSAETQWNPSNKFQRSSERVLAYEKIFSNGSDSIPFSIVVLRFISAANFTSDLALRLKELANSCLKSLQPIAPELLALRINTIDMTVWETEPVIYSLHSRPLEWKKTFCTFHSALRLLQSNKQADIKDFVPGEPTAFDKNSWNQVTNIMMRQRDSDHSGDLDKDEFAGLGDFAAVDIDHDERLTDVEYYRYLVEEMKQSIVATARNQIRAFAKLVESVKQSSGAFPKTLEALRNETKALTPGTISDPWGTPYHFSTDGTSFVIRSNGPDRVAGTDDDLSSQE